MANYTQNDNLIDKIFENGDIITINYTGNYKEIKLLPGRYKIECWGAQGQNGSVIRGGYGAYTSGIIYLKDTYTFYLYVGSQTTGFNTGAPIQSILGGGSSDIRLQLNNIRSRIMVAAGGGGGSNSDNSGAGRRDVERGLSAGGSLMGLKTTRYFDGDPGTQTSGGIGKSTNGWGGSTSGGFGFAGIARWSNTGNGGNGYYGSGGGEPSSSYNDGVGGGGSSFISGHYGCNAIDSNGVHQNNPNHYSGLIFTETIMIPGQHIMPDFNNIDGETIGNIGHGKIRITVLSSNYYYMFIDNYNVNTITLDNFITDGLFKKELMSSKIETLLFASKTENLKMKIISKNQIIVNSQEINISNIENIWEINIKVLTPNNTNIKFLISNQEGWFTYKNDRWYIIEENSRVSSTIIDSIGMTASEILSISTESWTELFPEKEKFISFSALLTTEEFDTTPMLSNIIVKYDAMPHSKKKIYDTLYSTRYKVTEYIVTWNTIDKQKIEIIFWDKI